MKIQQGVALPLGVTLLSDGKSVNVSVWAKDAKTCNLHLFSDKKKLRTIEMESMAKDGMEDIFSIALFDEKITEELSELEYIFEADGKEFVDPYARVICGREKFGCDGKIRGGFCFDVFDWSGENRSKLTFSEMIMYQCHVRGFTKHASSKVLNPGTFSGITEKIPYLKELGVNTLLLLPVYDFDEVFMDLAGNKKINYWGYTGKAYYFAPKASYAGTAKSGITELKEMIKVLHQNKMNVLFDMHFAGKIPDFILECLRYYVTEFHVDGFLLNQDVVSAELVMHDPVLRNVKLLGTGWQALNENAKPKRLGAFNDGFLVDARRFLKSDEGMVGAFYQRFKEQGGENAVINYITQKNGFTLNDLVSYDIKHNEDNGEKNKDGTEYNYSWNCGAEGVTRKKSVLLTRERQMKNAFAMLLLSLGTPMILAGDEFGNSQKGNNNAYCQDNLTTWVDWRLLDKNAWLFDYVKKLIQFRKEKEVYDGRIMKNMDYKGVGAPDISCHGLEPWGAGFANYSRELGVLFYKSYLEDDSSLYIAINMHWEPHTFFLPDVDKKVDWKVFLDTSGKEGKLGKKNNYVVAPRTIVIFEEVPGPNTSN